MDLTERASRRFAEALQINCRSTFFFLLWLNRRFSYIICGQLLFIRCKFFRGLFGVFRVYSAFSLRNCRFYA